jgi:hypothetical protein
MSLASGSRKKLRDYYGVPEQAIPQSQVAQYVLYLPPFRIHVAMSHSPSPRTYPALKIDLLTSLFSAPIPSSLKSQTRRLQSLVLVRIVRLNSPPMSEPYCKSRPYLAYSLCPLFLGRQAIKDRSADRLQSRSEIPGNASKPEGHLSKWWQLYFVCAVGFITFAGVFAGTMVVVIRQRGSVIEYERGQPLPK